MFGVTDYVLRPKGERPQPIVAALHLVAVAAGCFFVGAALLSAIRTFALPRSANDPVTRPAFGLSSQGRAA